MSQPGTIGYLVDKLDVLRVEGTRCNRHGRYSVARLSRRAVAIPS
jgi:hypothetical protein